MALALSVLIGLITSEIVLAGIFRVVGLHGWQLFLATSIAGTAGFIYWWWATGKFLNKPSRLQKALLDFIEGCDQWFAYYFNSKFARGLVLFLILLIGAAPFGVWLAGVVYCKKKDLTIGFWLLALGNIFKIGYSVMTIEAGLRLVN